MEGGGIAKARMAKDRQAKIGNGEDWISIAGISNAMALDSYEREGLRGSGNALHSRDLPRREWRRDGTDGPITETIRMGTDMRRGA